MSEGNLFTLKKYKKDSIIYLENTKAKNYFYIVHEGQVRRTVKLGDEEEVFELNKGDNFGFVGCMTGLFYLERVSTLTDCTVIVINRDNLIPFLSQKRDIFLKLIKDYSNQLRHFDEILQELTKSVQSSDGADLILQAAEYFHKNQMTKQMKVAFKKYIKYSNNTTKIEAIKKKFELDGVEENVESKKEFSRDDIIFLEQEIGEKFYFIEKGRVKISHIYRDRELILSILNEGEFFGEMALLNRQTRMASAISFDNTSLLILDKNNFFDKLGIKILQKIFISLAKRLYHTHRRVMNLMLWDPVAKLYDCLEYLIATNQGVKHENSFHFYFTLEELKAMTDIGPIATSQIQEFLQDDNIRQSYGEMVIISLEKFYLKARKIISVKTSSY